MIEWNRVTWYSKSLAIIVFVGTFGVAFYLGVNWERLQIQNAITQTPAPTENGSGNTGGAPVVGAGEHCGGFIQNAPVCETGYHCELKVSMPDIGGTCVPDQGTTTTPEWAKGMAIITQADRGTTVRLAKNERFAIELGDNLTWTVKFSPSGAITRVANSVSTGGFQGVYEADQTGTATMTATGAPICKAGEACPQFLVNVTVTFAVGTSDVVPQ